MMTVEGFQYLLAVKFMLGIVHLSVGLKKRDSAYNIYDSKLLSHMGLEYILSIDIDG